MKNYRFEAQGLILDYIEAQNIKKALNTFAKNMRYSDWNDMLRNIEMSGGNTVQVFVINKKGYSTEIKHLRA